MHLGLKIIRKLENITENKLITSSPTNIRMRIDLIVVLLLLNLGIGYAYQNPFRNENICGAPRCDTSFKKFGFEDKIYKYEYNIDLTTEFSGTGGNASNLFMKAFLDLFFPSYCEGFLRITDVKLWDYQVTQKDVVITNNDDSTSLNLNEDDYYGEFTDSTNYDESRDESVNIHPKSFDLALDLKKYLLRFSFKDGLISEVCPSSKEAVWTLNIKKGILSALQNTMLRFDVDFNTTETDISGECIVRYSLEDVNDVFIKIRKTKAVSTCRNRYSTNSILQTTNYNFRDDNKIWPILDSKSYCDMTINNNLYQEITCHDQHQLIPFSSSNTGATTRVISRLVLQEEKNYSRGEFLAQHDMVVAKRSTLVFDHTPSVKPTHSEIKLARDLLKEICNLGFPNIQRTFIKVFTTFLRTIKQLDYDALTQLLARSTSICEKGKNHILDALPYVGSTTSYQLMRDQLLTNKVSKKIALNWLKSLSFIQHPDEDTVETFYTILVFSHSRAEPEYTLSASAVLHSYCRHNVDCSQNMRVKWITDSLETEFIQVFNSFRGEQRLYKRMIVILKGLGNVGILSEHFVEQLQKIISDNIAPIGIRLESVFAFRRSNCNKYRSLFLNIYTNFTINSEVRIAAYLQVMICPDYYSISKIKNVLNIEEINQVGSFVWSHLRNLAKSSSPVNIAVQSLLLNTDFSDKFQLDLRKYSRNYQQNIFLDEYNFGSTTDINIIFGTESYLPRMATFNLTTNLFGKSINLFEITARTEGFEQFLSSIFSPENLFELKNSFYGKGPNNFMDIVYNWVGRKSSYNNDVSNSSINGSHKTSSENQTYTMNDLDERRAAFQKGIKKWGYTLKYDYNHPMLQFGMRIFGNDLHYYYLNGIPEFVELAKEFNILQQASEILSGKEITYTKSNVLLDASYVVPLVVGLPLSVDIFGASSIDLRASGKLHRLYTAPSDWMFDIKGTLKPTVLVDIVGSMSSDIFYEQSGIKVKATMYSNSEVAGELKVRGTSLVSLSFSLPQNITEIFSAHSELLKTTKSEDESITEVKSHRENSTCSWSLLDAAIGLKMCINYSVPNLNKSKPAIFPGLLLSGPMKFSIVLAKSDQHTKKWLFEYTSVQQRNVSKFAFVFLTPGSSIERLIMSNASIEPEVFNSSISFVNGHNKVSALCTFFGNRNNRRFDFLLITNGNRSMELNMELKRQQERNVLVYKPKVLFAINGVNITGAVGTVRINVKNGIVQSDMDFSFETRKLQMLIRGLISQNEVKKAANITMNYRFQANKIESIHFEGRLINSGDKAKIEYEAFMKLETSAYPKLNFDSNATWISLQGHTEGILVFNNARNVGDLSPPSVLHLKLARSHSEESVWEGLRLYASFGVKIPSSKIDYKLFLNHEERYKNGSENNIIVGARLSPEKEASILLSILLPQHHLLGIDAFFNISVSNFNSCYGRLKFAEKFPKTYLINFNGTWFTEQSIAIKAKHVDHSTRLRVLKMIIESGSFKTIILNGSYRRVQTFIYSNVQVKYGEDPYGLVIQVNSQPDNIKTSICEMHLQWQEKMYWINASMLYKQPLMLQVEIHLDKLRDIYLKSSVMHLDSQKELSLELNWDRNRDPSQNLLLSAKYKKPSSLEYNGQVFVKYPDRTVSCIFNGYTSGPEYYGDVYVSWTTNELVNIKYSLVLVPGNNMNNCIHIEIYTPFKGWRKNHLEAGVYNFGTLFLANASLLWGGNENMQLTFMSDINIDRIPSNLNVHFGLNSSFSEMPTLNMKIKLWYDLTNCDTEVSLRYNHLHEAIKIYSWKSAWELNKNRQYRNISGSVLILTPHKQFWKGGLVTKFCFKGQNKVIGAASLLINLREITLVVDGYVNKYNDNMITINITTPLSKFRNINGRFGLIEKKKHLVAEIRTPITALGIEVLFDIKSLVDFDVKLSVATPAPDLRHAAFYTKLKRETVDMRCILNNTTVGFIGAWYMNDLTDFEYSCKVFTPLKNFEENGAVFKFLKKDLFMLNLHSKLSRYSFGIQLNGKPKSPILKQLGKKIIELESRYNLDFKPPKIEASEYTYEEHIEYEEFFSYNMEILLDLCYWPTIEGMLEIEEIFDYYFAVANIKLPQGYVDIKNNLYFPDYLNIINVLSLETPFKALKKTKLVLEHRVDINLQNFYEKIYYIGNTTAAVNHPNRIGFEANYSQIYNFLKTPEHRLTLNLALPSNKEVDVTGIMYLEDSLFTGNLKTTVGKTCLSLATAFQAEENFYEASVDISLEVDAVSNYNCNVYFKHEFSELDSSFVAKLDINNETDIKELQAEYIWQIESSNGDIISNGKIINTMMPLKSFEYSFLLNREKTPKINIDFGFSNQKGMRVDYGMRAKQINEVINIEIWTPMSNFKNISVHGTLIHSFSDQYKFEGIFYRDMVAFNLTGVVHMKDGYLKTTGLQIISLSGGPGGLFEISVIRNNDTLNEAHFLLNASENGKLCKISGDYSYNNLSDIDLSVVVQSTEAEIERIYLISTYKFPNEGRKIAKLSIETPWRQMGLGKVDLWLDINKQSDQGNINGGYKFDDYMGYENCEWFWRPGENMRLVIESNIDRPHAKSNFVFTELKYVNPNISFQPLSIGGKLNLSSILNFEVNGNVNYKSVDEIQFTVRTLWPIQNNEIHELSARYHGNSISRHGKNLDLFFEGKYSAQISKRCSTILLTYKNDTALQTMALVKWGIANNISTFQADIQLSRKAQAREILAKLFTPKFENEATLLFIGSYDPIQENYNNVNWSIYYPSSRRVSDMAFSIQSFKNLSGQINCTTPFSGMAWFKAVFNFSTNGVNSYRFCRVDWPEDFSFLRLNKIYTRDESNNALEGNIELEVPLNIRHRATIKYGFNEKPKLDKGNLNIYYNEKLILNIAYQQTKQNYTILKETTDIIINNIIKPIGIHFVNSSDLRNTKRFRHIEIFDLNNTKNFNLTFELHVITSETAKDIKLVAIHPNRTVILRIGYNRPCNLVISHRGKLELSDTAWIGYNVVIGNNTNNEIRNFVAELSYPQRNLSISGVYLTTSTEFNSNMSFEWSGDANKDTRAIRTTILWRTEELGQEDLGNQTIIFALKHHLLEKDLKFKGSFYCGKKDLLKANILIDYAHDLDHSIGISTTLKDLRNRFGTINYTMQFLTYHKASELEVQFNGSAIARPYYFKVQSKSIYRKDYLPEKQGLFLVLFDSKNKEIEYTRKSPYRTVRVWLQPITKYPVYGLNAVLWNTPAVNNSGYLYVNIIEKEAHMYFNLTEDGSHKLLMFGCIPNSRRSYISVWRNYEEISVIDVSSHIKLNHSRHLSGRLNWRPEIKSELKEKIDTINEALLSSYTELIDFWTKTLNIETVSALTLVWETAREYNKDFIDDVSQLSALKDDLDGLRVFMNKSYEANDFYIKTVVNFTYAMLDEISLRDHVDSLPIILSEIRQVLEEAGRALSRNIVQLVEMIRSTYNSIIKAGNNFFHGQPLKYFTDLMKNFLEKYEQFAKEVHISFINHIEFLWNNISHAISTYFKGVLKRLEPHIFKAMTFVEKAVWDLSKEVFDFIYERTNELAESAYFNQVSSFTQDIENLYKDIKSHDVFLSFKKYTSIFWRFLKEKYYKLIPFGSELNEVIHEIWNEIKELEKIKQFQVVIRRINDMASEMEWITKEIKIRRYLPELFVLIRNKLRNYALNALEVANMYREAKTKFLFDPEKGVIDLEQKLPLSWHAFNETPKFQEIAEYKLISQVQNLLTANSTSIFEHIYDFQSYLDPITWMAPHYSRGFLINSRFYITFDKRLVTVYTDTQPFINCTYLLSHDFWNNSFTLTVDFSTTTNDSNLLPVAKFNLIAKGHIFEIDPTSNTLAVDGIHNPLLPINVDDFIVQKYLNILSVSSGDGYKLECNMQFDLCWFELSSQYFGQTAGLLGTMNNEPFDDFITPSNTIAKSEDIFTDAWSLKISNEKTRREASKVLPKEVTEACHELFSSLTLCSNRVDPQQFISICKEVGYKAHRTHPGHPTHQEYCTAALAYIEVCRLAKIPMRVPQQCVLCEISNGSLVPESTFVEYNTNRERHSCDIVLLLEANTCNTYANGNKSIESLVTALEEQLDAQNFINNRFAVIAYGAQIAPFEVPRIISNGNEIFVNADKLRTYLNHVASFLEKDNGLKSNSDILHAISTASKLNYRPGVSKAFILLSCNRCEVNQMQFDYSSILQYMNEESVSLHILADIDFILEKPRKSRHLFGFDKHFVYSNRFPEGESETRQSLQISKNILGICTPLALETGGSVFSLRKIMTERKNAVRRFVTIFAKRVVQSAVPIGNQTCECTGHNTGAAYMVCTSSALSNQKFSFEQNDLDFSGLDWQSETNDLE